MSNVKQLALGTMMYCQDYDERLPASYTIGAPAGARYWFEILQPYIKNTQLLVCPSWSSYTLGYGWNYSYLTYSWHSPAGYGYGGCPIGEIKTPAETILLADSGAHTVTGGTWDNGMTYVITYARNPGNYFVYLRHNETANVAFCDGHAKASNEGYVTNPANFDLN